MQTMMIFYLKAFEDHKAFLNITSLKRHMIIGKKGSGGKPLFLKNYNKRINMIFSHRAHVFRFIHGTITNVKHGSHS
jgi:hypothetical protein